MGYPTKNALKSWHREFEQDRDLPTGYVRLRQKYSAEQKRVEVEHYHHNGRCLAGTLEALGYPCRETLSVWIDELHPETRTRVVGKAGSVPLPREFKQAAVIELFARQTSARAVARKLGNLCKTLTTAVA